MVCVAVPDTKAKVLLLFSTDSTSEMPSAKAWLTPAWVKNFVLVATLM